MDKRKNRSKKFREILKYLKMEEDEMTHDIRITGPQPSNIDWPLLIFIISLCLGTLLWVPGALVNDMVNQHQYHEPVSKVRPATTYGREPVVYKPYADNLEVVNR